MSRSVELELDQLDMLHASLAIQHNCKVDDIYRVLCMGNPQHPRWPNKYYTTFKLVSKDGQEYEIYSVGTILPVCCTDDMNQPRSRHNFGACVSECRPEAHNDRGAPVSKETKHERRKNDAQRAREYYNSIKERINDLKRPAGKYDNIINLHQLTTMDQILAVGTILLMILAATGYLTYLLY